MPPLDPMLYFKPSVTDEEVTSAQDEKARALAAAMSGVRLDPAAQLGAVLGAALPAFLGGGAGAQGALTGYDLAQKQLQDQATRESAINKLIYDTAADRATRLEGKQAEDVKARRDLAGRIYMFGEAEKGRKERADEANSLRKEQIGATAANTASNLALRQEMFAETKRHNKETEDSAAQSHEDNLNLRARVQTFREKKAENDALNKLRDKVDKDETVKRMATLSPILSELENNITGDMTQMNVAAIPFQLAYIAMGKQVARPAERLVTTHLEKTLPSELKGWANYLQGGVMPEITPQQIDAIKRYIAEKRGEYNTQMERAKQRYLKDIPEFALIPEERQQVVVENAFRRLSEDLNAGGSSTTPLDAKLKRIDELKAKAAQP